MQVHVMPVTLFQSNCIVVWDDETLEGFVVDPGGDTDRIMGLVQRKKINVAGIFLTHGHVDHVAGSNKLKEATGAPVYLHPARRELAEMVPRQCAFFGMPMEEAPRVDKEMQEGDLFRFGAIECSVLHTPGHSPGGVCLYFPKSSPPLMITGDLLFAGSIGRTDLPGGSGDRMKESLDRVVKFPDDLRIIPGHGPQTTIGHERKRNPYLITGATDW